ncbi:MAG: ATP-binding protein [Alphaproteobacteria bacterium]|nr:ATP-binding protein [Alphaproteobacteria bacterium]
MDPVRNPFAPGAGSPPPELAGRSKIIDDANIALQRILIGRHSQSQMLLGLRGTGKTVLLNAIERLADSHRHATSFIEAPEDQSLQTLLYPKIHQVLRHFSGIEAAKAYAYSAMRSLQSFASVFKISIGDVSLSVDPEPGNADSGFLEYDLGDLFVRVGEAAKAANSAWTLLIDEVQYLSNDGLSALIVAIHRVNQRQLPIIFFGAGLPQLAALSGEAKSYAERLFAYPHIGALDEEAAIDAITQPIKGEGCEISDEAVGAILRKTECYPYFLQEWGYQSWNIAQSSPISADDVEGASGPALHRLDEGFFKVRFDRLTPKERKYVSAMASLGRGPYKAAEVADAMGENPKSLGPCRASIIHKGMIYSPSYGDIDFTVPMFDQFMRRMEEKK